MVFTYHGGDSPTELVGHPARNWTSGWIFIDSFQFWFGNENKINFVFDPHHHHHHWFQVTTGECDSHLNGVDGRDLSAPGLEVLLEVRQEDAKAEKSIFSSL